MCICWSRRGEECPVGTFSQKLGGGIAAPARVGSNERHVALIMDVPRPASTCLDCSTYRGEALRSASENGNLEMGSNVAHLDRMFVH